MKNKNPAGQASRLSENSWRRYLPRFDSRDGCPTGGETAVVRGAEAAVVHGVRRLSYAGRDTCPTGREAGSFKVIC